MTDNRDVSRLRQRLNPLLTSLGGYSQHSHTPVSAVSYSSNSYMASTPASAIQPYNPQQWIPSPMPGSDPERAQVQQMSSPESNGTKAFRYVSSSCLRVVSTDIYTRLPSPSSTLLPSSEPDNQQHVSGRLPSCQYVFGQDSNAYSTSAIARTCKRSVLSPATQRQGLIEGTEIRVSLSGQEERTGDGVIASVPRFWSASELGTECVPAGSS